MEIISNNNEKCEIALTGLYEVYDPEIGLNIVDLGLVYELFFDDENNKIVCTITLTTEFCPMGETILDNTKRTLENYLPEYEIIEVNLSFDPRWSYDMISDKGREFLNA